MSLQTGRQRQAALLLMSVVARVIDLYRLSTPVVICMHNQVSVLHLLLRVCGSQDQGLPSTLPPGGATSTR